jgi:uncharacterized membrane protein
MLIVLRNFIFTLLSFFAIDLLWLGLVARGFYRSQIGFLLADRTNWLAAGLFYFFYLVGLSYFVLYPALAKGSWQSALLNGLLFGFMAYMTYDLTNLATLKSWPVLLTVVDITWGTLLTGGTALISFWLIRLF